jgi:hypothetical protein
VGDAGFRTRGYQVAVCRDDTTNMRRPGDASASALPPAGLLVIIQLEGGALSMLERFLAKAWSGVPEAAWIGLGVAGAIGVLYLNGRFLHSAPIAPESSGASAGLDAIAVADDPGFITSRAAPPARPSSAPAPPA